MDYKLNELFLTRRNKVVITPVMSNLTVSASVESMINHIQANIADMGYTLSGDIINKLKKLTQPELAYYYKLFEATLSEMTGDNVDHIPLFLNFPEDVPFNDEYYFYRMIGFIQNVLDLTVEDYKVLSCGHTIDKELFDLNNFGACPICQMRVDMDDLGEAKERPSLDEITPFKILHLGTEDDLFSIFKNLVSSATSISDSDRADITTFFDVLGKDVLELIPAQIPFIENKIFVAKLIIENLESGFGLSRLIKTSTDLLRFMTALSDGDISLAENCKFRNFSRVHRRSFLAILNKVGSSEDMLRYKTRWIRIGEKLHPGEYESRYPKAFLLFKALRDNQKIETFRGRVEGYLADGNWFHAMNMLKTRPGEFARRLDLLLRLSNESIHVTDSFDDIVNELPTRILLQLLGHFNDRSVKQDLRVFFPKGSFAKMQSIKDDRATITQHCTFRICLSIENALIAKFSIHDPLEKVFVDQELRNYLVPFSQRSASKALFTITRGSRVNLPDTKVIRAFLHWMDDSERTDLDLTLSFYDADWKELDHISYTHLENDYANHSGDLQSAPPPHGSSEFVDIDITKAKENGVRYALMQIYDYTGNGYVILPECFAGIMGREEAVRGLIFEPRTVAQKFDITSEVQISIPMILDLEDMQMIWTDISLKSRITFLRNVESNRSNVELMGRSMVNLYKTKPNLYQLFYLHSIARGTVVNTREEADLVFDIKDAQSLDKIMAEFME